jgi:hypothetical protein
MDNGYIFIMADVHQKAQKIETWVVDCLSIRDEPVTNEHMADATFVHSALADVLNFLGYKPPTTTEAPNARLELDLIQARLQLMGARRNLRHVLNNVPMNAQPREQLVMMIAELDETLAAAKVKPGTDTLPVSQR